MTGNCFTCADDTESGPVCQDNFVAAYCVEIGGNAGGRGAVVLTGLRFDVIQKLISHPGTGAEHSEEWEYLPCRNIHNRQ